MAIICLGLLNHTTVLVFKYVSEVRMHRLTPLPFACSLMNLIEFLGIRMVLIGYTVWT